jgi:ketosteroid isomerase-like protein
VPRDAEIAKRGWEAVARGDWDTLVADYTDDMIFVMPGRNNSLGIRMRIDGQWCGDIASAAIINLALGTPEATYT